VKACVAGIRIYQDMGMSGFDSDVPIKMPWTAAARAATRDDDLMFVWYKVARRAYARATNAR